MMKNWKEEEGKVGSDKSINLVIDDDHMKIINLQLTQNIKIYTKIWLKFEDFIEKIKK